MDNTRFCSKSRDIRLFCGMAEIHGNALTAIPAGCQQSMTGRPGTQAIINTCIGLTMYEYT